MTCQTYTSYKTYSPYKSHKAYKTYPSYLLKISLLGLISLIAVFGITKTADAALLQKAPNNLGLVGYWSFEDGVGDKATDFSGSGNTGTLTNMEAADWVAGKRGKALSFDGVNEYVKVINPTELNSTGAITLSAWIKPTNLSDYHAIAGKGNSNTGEPYAMLLSGTSLYFRISGSFGDSNNNTGGTVQLNQWQHLVATFDSSTGAKKGYINGSLVIDATVAGTLKSETSNFYIGVQGNEVNSLFNGSIDEVRIYNRALGASEVTYLYESSVQRFNSATTNLVPEGLVAHHTFDGGYLNTTTSTDRSGEGNDGTLTNGPVPVLGRLGQALSFDGVDDYINVADSTTLNTASVTVSAWVKPSTIASTRKPIVQYYYPGSIPSGYLLANYQSAFSFCVNTGTYTGSASCGGYDIKTASSLSVNTWYHLVGSFDGGTKLRSIYLNGVLENSTSTPAGINYTDYPTRLSFEISRDYQGNAGMPGLIDDVRIYNRALSPAEVQTLYTGSKHRINTNVSSESSLTSGLVAHHTFDGPRLNTTTSTDSSGEGNDGTLTNGPVPVLGKLGQALSFDGSDDYVNISSLPAMTNGGSICAWSKLISNGSYPQVVAYNSGGKYWELRYNGDTRIPELLWNYSTPGEALASEAVSLGEWNHLCGTASSGVVTLYVNGEQKAQASGGTYAAPSAIQLGRRYGGGFPFPGSIDEVRIYNRALSPAEVLQLYELGN